MPITDNSPWWQEQQNSNRPLNLNWNVYPNPNSNSKLRRLCGAAGPAGQEARGTREEEYTHHGNPQQEGSSH